MPTTIAKVKYTNATVKALKRMKEKYPDIMAYKGVYQSPKINVSFQSSGVTVHNTWSISEVNRMAKIHKK